MNCRLASDALTAYLDGELEPTTASAVRGHLRTCPRCHATAEEHARIRDELAGLSRPEPPGAMWNGVLARLGEAEIADAGRSRWSRWLARGGERLRPHLVPAALAATACGVALAWTQVRSAHETQGDASDDVSAEVDESSGPDLATRAPALATSVAPDPRDVPRRDAPSRDASDELAAERARIEEQFRTAVAELLPLARAEAIYVDGRARRRFDREVAALEAAVVRAAAGKDRDRAWHALIVFLERAALGAPAGAVALGDGGRGRGSR